MLEIKNDNILLASEKYIAHQCNCVTAGAAFLAKSIFDKFSYADVYSLRKEHSTPGTIEIRGNGVDERYVIAMFAQYYPGFPKSEKDSKDARINYFISCLKEISKIENLESIAFPFRIGCGAAGGDWSKYLEILSDFSKDKNVVLYKVE